MQATLTSRVYAAVILNQGSTSRDINKLIGKDSSIAKTLSQLSQRGALLAVPDANGRSTRYYKGRAPVKLNQPTGTTQKKLEARASAAAANSELEAEIAFAESYLQQLKQRQLEI